MNGQRVAAVVILLGALFALGTMAASLDSTVSASPNDAIDVGPTTLPFVGDGPAEIARAYEKSPDGTRRMASSEPADRPASEGTSANAGDGEDRGGNPQSDATGGQSADDGERDSGAGSRDGTQRGGTGQSAGQQGEGGTGDGEGSLLQRLLRALVALLALLALLAGVAYAIRHRERLLARVRALVSRYVPGREPSADEVPDPHGDAEPSTVVERAWGQMVARSPADPPESDTPGECAAAVIDAGADAAAVEDLTAMYERVRYGGGSITPDDASRALVRLREVAPAAAETPAVGGEVSRSSSANGDGRGPAPSDLAASERWDAATDGGEGRA